MLDRIKMNCTGSKRKAALALLGIFEERAAKDPIYEAWLVAWAEHGETVILRDILCSGIRSHERLRIIDMAAEAGIDYQRFDNVWLHLDTARAKCNPNYPKD